jgi:dTDP-4-dehydrorhamnose reductase
MNIFLTGSSGQLGQSLLPLLTAWGRVEGLDRTVLPGDRNTKVQDLSDLNRVEILLNRTMPDLVINAAAYTAVDQAETDSDTAFRLNADLPGCLARWADRNGRLLVHYSTDYVFSGDSTQPYRETGEPGPLNVYGESKLAGESAISSTACSHVTLRTSWVYSSHGSNFVLTMLRLAQDRPELSIVNDQVGRPTWAKNLARVSAEIIQRIRNEKGSRPAPGLLHYCDAGIVNWYDFARMIFSTAQRLGVLERVPDLTPVPTANFPQAAQRPLYSVLDTTAVSEAYGIEPASLQESLQSCIEETTVNDD